MTDPPNRRIGLPPGTGAKLAAAFDETQALGDEIDGLTIDRTTGTFRHRGLIRGWIIVGGIKTEPGGLGLTWLMVLPEPETSDARVTSRLLRSVPVAGLLNEILQRLSRVDGKTRTAYAAMTGKTASWPSLKVHEQRGGRRRVDDPRTQALLRRVAITYLNEMGTRGVYARVAKKLRRDQGAIKALVRAARADGWLSAAEHGVRGAQPGPRLRKELEGSEG